MMKQQLMTKDPVYRFSPKTVIAFLARRVIVCYALLGILFFIFVDVSAVKWKAVAAALSRLSPESFEYLVDVVEAGKPFERRDLDHYLQYFEVTDHYMPGRPDTNSLLGFCYYSLGDRAKAIRYYEKAIEYYPDYFTFYFDLGLIYYQQQDYAKAAKLFERANRTILKENLNFIAAARLYYPLAMNYKNLDYDLKMRLKAGYHDNYYMLLRSLWQREDYMKMLLVANEAMLSNLDQSGEFYYLFGHAALALKKDVDAARMLDQAVQKNPDFTEAFYELGLALQAMGREEQGKLMLQKAALLRQLKGESLPTETSIRVRAY